MEIAKSRTHPDWLSLRIVNIFIYGLIFVNKVPTIKFCDMQTENEIFKEMIAEPSFAYSLGLALPISLLLWLFILAFLF